MVKARPFFLLVFGLSLPFWLAGAVTGSLGLPVDLPLGALQAVVPAVAASVLVYRERGGRAVRSLLARAFDAKKVPRAWYLPILVLWPALMLIAFGLMKSVGEPLPEQIALPGLGILAFVIVFFVSAATEQLGWQAYAFDHLHPKVDTVTASVIIGGMWALWHVVPFMQIPQPPTWILWQCLAMIPFRVLIGWIYVGTGRSVFATIAFQTMANVSQFSFPNFGSAYDPFYAFLLLSALAIAVAAWGLRPGHGLHRAQESPSVRA